MSSPQREEEGGHSAKELFPRALTATREECEDYKRRLQEQTAQQEEAKVRISWVVKDGWLQHPVNSGPQ